MDIHNILHPVGLVETAGDYGLPCRDSLAEEEALSVVDMLEVADMVADTLAGEIHVVHR